MKFNIWEPLSVHNLAQKFCITKEYNITSEGSKRKKIFCKCIINGIRNSYARLKCRTVFRVYGPHRLCKYIYLFILFKIYYKYHQIDTYKFNHKFFELHWNVWFLQWRELTICIEISLKASLIKIFWMKSLHSFLINNVYL